MKRLASKIFAVVVFVATAWAMTPAMMAQGVTSPYSKYGYGLLGDNATSTQRSMGGVGYAMNSGRQVNAMNPASYAAMDSLTFLWDLGLDLTRLTAKEGETTSKSFGGGLDYITMQFPLSKTVGASIGVVPFSSVGYSFGTDIKNGKEARVGTGGISQLYAGAGWRPFKGFSIGANFSYNFGTLVNSTYVYPAGQSYYTLFERVMQVRDWGVQIGAQYTTTIAKKHKATLGVVYTPSKSFHGNTWGAYYNSQDAVVDTVGYTKLAGKYTSPHTFGAGINYQLGDRLMVEADFTYQPWSKVKYVPIQYFEGVHKEDVNEFAKQETMFDNRWKAAVGAQYVHNPRGNFIQRTAFRAGAYYNHDYINVKGSNVRDYGVSVGFGLPTPNSKTVVNLGFEYKHRTSSPVRYVTENYFNITLGVNFNEAWFWKNKIR